jgi:uncharacterized protein
MKTECLASRRGTEGSFVVGGRRPGWFRRAGRAWVLIAAMSLSGCLPPFPGMGYNAQAGMTPEQVTFQERQRSCEAGVHRDCVGLGMMYVTGRGVARDVARGEALIEGACDAGDLVGCAALGGLLVSRDEHARGIALLERACGNAGAEGCYLLGLAYVNGEGVAQDAAQAFRHFELGCREGSLDACAGLGQVYIDGIGVERDAERGLMILARSCDGGSMTGCVALADAMMLGRDIPRDPSRAAQLYGVACESGDVAGCRGLALQHISGVGAPQNF